MALIKDQEAIEHLLEAYCYDIFATLLIFDFWGRISIFGHFG